MAGNVWPAGGKENWLDFSSRWLTRSIFRSPPSNRLLATAYSLTIPAAKHSSQAFWELSAYLPLW